MNIPGALTLVIVSLLMINVRSTQAQIFGDAIVIDGDTIEIGDQRVRLFGIDAPEKRQICLTSLRRPYNCGKRSKIFLRKIIDGKPVRCKDLGQAKFGRRWGRCFANSLNLQSVLVRNGHARAYRFHSREYIAEQKFAKKTRSGIWQGDHVRPGLFRKCWRKGGSPRQCSR